MVILVIVATVLLMPTVLGDLSCNCYWPKQMHGKLAIDFADKDAIFNFQNEGSFTFDFDRSLVYISFDNTSNLNFTSAIANVTSQELFFLNKDGTCRSFGSALGTVFPPCVDNDTFKTHSFLGIKYFARSTTGTLTKVYTVKKGPSHSCIPKEVSLYPNEGYFYGFRKWTFRHISTRKIDSSVFEMNNRTCT